MSTTDEECVAALLKAAERLGESPTKAQYEELGLTPSHSTILRIMGSWNEAKEAAGLETFTQTEGGGPIQPKPDWVDLPDEYEWTELSPQQRWYYQNREHRLHVKTRRKKELQRWFYEYKRDEFWCERCGEGYPACLDFHHIGTKNMDVSKMVNHGYSRESILAEIDRCVVLCANCHRKEHYELLSHSERAKLSDNESPENLSIDRRWDHAFADLEGKARQRKELRLWVYRYKQATGGCVRCDEDGPACLEFHHVNEDEKTVSIGNLIAYGPSKERLLEEIEKCELLCRNCHRKEHYEIPSKIGGKRKDIQ